MGSKAWALVRLMLTVLVAGVVVAAVLVPLVLGTGLLARSAADRFLNARCDVIETPPPQRSTLYARDGKTTIAHLFTQNRAPVRLDQVPHDLVHALIATEDR